MTEVEKFVADARRVVKRDRADNGGAYDGLRASRKVAELFCGNVRSLGDLPNSIAEYWLDEHVASSESMDDEPSAEHIEWLASALSFLYGTLEKAVCFSDEDWRKLAEFVNYEAEDLPIDVLSSLMGVLVERRVL